MSKMRESMSPPAVSFTSSMRTAVIVELEDASDVAAEQKLQVGLRQAELVALKVVATLSVRAVALDIGEVGTPHQLLRSEHVVQLLDKRFELE